ncbi:MAG: substrate-binding domain-containing protein [Mucinivorans sp.]
MKKIIFSILALVALSFSLTACFPNKAPEPPIGSVAVVFPSDESNTHWKDEHSYLMQYLQTLNFATYYGLAPENDAKTQAEQIRYMKDHKVQFMIFCTVDAYSNEIASALEEYVSGGGKILAFDRLQQNALRIDALVSVSYKAIGALQYKALEALPRGSKVEMISGPKYDNNASVLFDAASELVVDNIKMEKWICPSGQKDYAKTKADSWSSDDAYRSMKSVLSAFYPNNTMPDAVLVSNDAQAKGVINALRDHNPTIGKFPIITGMNCDQEALQNIMAGRQTMSINRNVIGYMKEVLDIVAAWAKGQQVELPTRVVNQIGATVPYKEVQDVTAIYAKDVIK